LQAFLMADDFPIAQGDLKRGDQGDAVLRFQRSLSAMGVLLDLPDSFYGANTQRSVRLVQWANDLPQTGVADVALQQLVFSGKAKPLPGALLTQGSSGDEVKKLQQRLHALGFLIGTPDGSFGAATATAVQNLQTYFQAQERAALQAQATHNAAGADRTAAPSAPKPGATALPTATAEPAIDETLLTTVVNGVADPLLLERFYAADFPDVPADMQSGASGEEVKRVQRRLYDLEYLFSSTDGAYGAGTATAITEFQKRNKLSQTGAADAATLKVLFSDDAKKALKPYVLKISIAKQRVYAYAPDKNGEYTKLVRTMKCSTGRDSTPTPKGTYQASTGTGARWHYFKKFDVWAQYAYYIQGDYMIHSVLYPSKNGRATSGSVGALGRKASHGCVRLSVEDAKWVYNNCPNKTKIIVY
ncbi:MAG: L,D-transpeptidase family protein, partial [Clostridiales bacterium]|nr:L,D-transpeptidase family protein [Clostridiales bacterium]